MRSRAGFTLIELAVVLVIVAVLAAFGVPRFIKSVERSKAEEAFSYLAAVRSSQERYHARHGAYTSSLSELDLRWSIPQYFAVGPISAGRTDSLNNSWTLTLTRSGASPGYGQYTVVFTEDGYDAIRSTIQDHPEINPMGI